jgi:hypothetical protein
MAVKTEEQQPEPCNRIRLAKKTKMNRDETKNHSDLE